MALSRFALLDGSDALLRHGWFEAKPPDPVGKGWRWVSDPYVAPPPPPPPTSDELAAQFDLIAGSRDTVELAVRAIVSLLADRMGITDEQAKTAVRARMKAIADGTRG